MKRNRRLLQMLIFMFLSLALMVNLSGCGNTPSDSGGGASSGDTSWSAVSTTSAPTARYGHTAVWTGSEMVVWGGTPDSATFLNTGGKYNPTTDSWTATATTSAPSARAGVEVWGVWTGTEMIIWGGNDVNTYFNTGGRYNPSTNSWTATTTTGAPTARVAHVAVWTGSEMIVWGGNDGNTYFNTGGKYNPTTDSWTATTTTSAPTARYAHVAVWTGTQMIVWGGGNSSSSVNTGGKYNPSTDSWTATTTTSAPTARYNYNVTPVWTGTEMIVWGGWNGPATYFNTGGRYNPTTDSWTATSTTNAPTARQSHKAVWTGTGGVMIVWGGTPDDVTTLNTGGRYNPTTDTWSATSTTNAPTARYLHTAVWTGSQMIVWGGSSSESDIATSSLNTGGRYTP